MTGVSIIPKGARELGIRFETMPKEIRARLKERISGLTDRLYERVQAATPVKTGELKNELTMRIFDDTPSRIAGYVSVFGPNSDAYAKAATLEYGSTKSRRVFKRNAAGEMMMRGKYRIVARRSSPVRIRAYRYLRGPAEAMRGEVEAAIIEASNEAIQVDEGPGSG